MISVEAIRKKAEHKFVPYLYSVLNGDDAFFPLHIPAARGSATDDFATRKTEAEKMYRHSKQAKGFGYTVMSSVVKTRSNGMQTVIEKILFESEADFLRFIQKETEACNFKTNLEHIKTQCFKLDAADIVHDWTVKHSSVLTESFDAQYWEQLFLCADWFIHHSPCGLYLREIPLPVHTKFIEQNRMLIFSLYCALKRDRHRDETGGQSSDRAQPLAAESCNGCSAGEKVTELQNTAEAIYVEWGVRTASPFIRLRLLDDAISVTIAGETLKSSEVQLPLEAFATLRFNSVDTIFIVENLLVYLTFPTVPKGLCIFGSGFAAVQLHCNIHLRQKKLYYFGDIDEHGFEILSEFRAIFPDVTSFCMDNTTYQTFAQFAVPGKSSKRNSADLYLTAEELALFRYLREHTECNRLEQERLPQDFIKERLASLITIRNSYAKL